MEYNTKTVKASELANPDNVKSVIDRLMYGSYAANRGYGMTHEQLLRLGIGNDAMKALYEQESLNNGN